MYLVDEIHQQSLDLDSTKEIRAVFLDISKASDDGLIFKMRQNGVSGRFLKLFQCYLNKRTYRVVINGFSADYSTNEYGAPQGIVLCPPLFLIYTNDLKKNIKSDVNYATFYLHLGILSLYETIYIYNFWCCPSRYVTKIIYLASLTSFSLYY